jgi:hypothetical protein
MEKETFTREQLYNEIWQTPLLTLSRKYNISDVGLRKLCVRLNIPLPKAGHWQKLQFGKTSDKIPLPVSNEDKQLIELELRTAESAANSGEPSEMSKRKNELKSQFSNDLKVPDTLENPEKIITSTRKHYLATYKRKWDSPDYSLAHLNLRVSEPQLQRALLFMDTLIKVLNKKGYELKVEGHETILLINQQEIKIALREKTKVVQTGTKSWERTNEPIGKFVLKIEAWGSKEWTEGSVSLEEKLQEIIVGIELKAEDVRQKEIERDNWHREHERQKAIKIEFEKLRKEDLLSFKDSLERAERWHKTNNLRAYIKELEYRAEQNNSYTDELKANIDRLRKQADWYDPFINAHDELLNVVNKATLDLPRGEYSW